MLSISAHSRQRAIEYGASVKELENLEYKYRIPNFPVAVFIRSGSRGNKLFAIVRDNSITTVIDFYRVPKPERFGVEAILM